MEEEERTFTPGQAEAMDALLSGRNVFLSGNAGTGKSYVLNAFIEELEEREVPYLAMAPTGIAAQNLHNGTTIHRTLQVGFGVLDPHDENKKTLTRKVLNKAEVVIIDEVSMCRIDLFERVMNMVLAAKRVSGRKQVVLVGDFFQLPPVVTDDDRKVLMQLWPGNDEGYAFKSQLWRGMGFEPHVLTEVVRQSDPEFIGQLNRARIGDRDCIGYFNERSISDRKRAPEDDLWLCATNRMASTINDERVGELERLGARARTYTAYLSGDVKPSDKPTDDKLRLVEGARVMLLANMPDHGLANGSLGTVSEVGADCVTVEFDDCGYPVEVSEKEWKVLKSSVRDIIGDDGNPAQELVTDTVGAFTQIPLRLAFAITIHKSQGQTFERCAVHSKVFGAGMREALAGDYDEETQTGEFWFDAEKEGPRGILEWLGFSADETEGSLECVCFEDSGYGAYRDDMGRAVFEACAPVIGAGSVLMFMENWDEAEKKDPRIWRYTFDGEKMHVQDGRFVFD